MCVCVRACSVSGPLLFRQRICCNEVVINRLTLHNCDIGKELWSPGSWLGWEELVVWYSFLSAGLFAIHTHSRYGDCISSKNSLYWPASSLALAAMLIHPFYCFAVDNVWHKKAPAFLVLQWIGPLFSTVLRAGITSSLTLFGSGFLPANFCALLENRQCCSFSKVHFEVIFVAEVVVCVQFVPMTVFIYIILPIYLLDITSRDFLLNGSNVVTETRLVCNFSDLSLVRAALKLVSKLERSMGHKWHRKFWQYQQTQLYGLGRPFLIRQGSTKRIPGGGGRAFLFVSISLKDYLRMLFDKHMDLNHVCLMFWGHIVQLYAEWKSLVLKRIADRPQVMLWLLKFNTCAFLAGMYYASSIWSTQFLEHDNIYSNPL